MFLVDTNIWLELLLEQEKAAEVRTFFEQVEASRLAITDFSLHSIGLILTRLKKDELFGKFLADVIQDSAITLIRLDISDLERLIRTRQEFSLDFDDAYQYVAAKTHNFILVSFDTDFDITEGGRKTPSEAMHLINSSNDQDQEK